MVIGVIIYIVGALIGLTIMLMYHISRYRSRSNYTFNVCDLVCIMLVMATSWVGVFIAGLTVGTETAIWKKSNEIRKS